MSYPIRENLARWYLIRTAEIAGNSIAVAIKVVNIHIIFILLKIQGFLQKFSDGLAIGWSLLGAGSNLVSYIIFPFFILSSGRSLFAPLSPLFVTSVTIVCKLHKTGSQSFRPDLLFAVPEMIHVFPLIPTVHQECVYHVP